MQKSISSALISVFYKKDIDALLNTLHQQGVTLYSTGGTAKHIHSLGLPCVEVESITEYPSILGGRVKTLHPKIFGGILGRRDLESDIQDMQAYAIPTIDLVIVDLYPFEETVANTQDEKLIIEKIDIGGPSMIRAAAKNFQYTTVIADYKDYEVLNQLLIEQKGVLDLAQRRAFAAKAFEVVKNYDLAIDAYFNSQTKVLRYGENPHQKASFEGPLESLFTQWHGKELSYNNLVDVDAAMQIMVEFSQETQCLFTIIKHTNVCGAALRNGAEEAWKAALACDPESAFGGILACNQKIDLATATHIQDIFFEVLIAPDFDEDAKILLQQKKNRILLQTKQQGTQLASQTISKQILHGTLTQSLDIGNIDAWDEQGGRKCSDEEKENLLFANLLCKHLKSNAIAIVKNKQLIGKGCGQTSRIDALKQAIEKAKHFGFDLNGAVLASDAFFPFDDCVKLAHQEGIEAFIQPGGSIRDKDSIAYCQTNNLALVMTGLRHFKH
ncbi:MAG: bifunctional phosphoribosylaminoimidazolecarboxamide formyltransferase/IMP cyclohydrolase [Chitinophagaceae bacterium]